MSDEPAGGFRRLGYDGYSSEDDEPHNSTSSCRGRQMPTSSPSQLQPSAKYPQPAPRTTISNDQQPYDTRMQTPRFINNDSQEDSRNHGSINKQGDLLYQPEISPRYDRDIKSGINNSQDIGDERAQKYHEDFPKKLENRYPQKNERKQEDTDDDYRRCAPRKEYDNENAPRRSSNENAPRRRVESPHHTVQDSDHDGRDSRYAPNKEYVNAPRRRVESPHHIDQDSDHEGYDSRIYAPIKEYDNENTPRKGAKSPQYTDQDSDHDSYESRRYDTSKEYNENTPRRGAKSPHQPDQDSRRYAPGKEYDHENVPRRRIKSPHQPDQDSDNDGHDSTRFASGKENYNENAPRRRVKSPHHTDQDSDRVGQDSRRHDPGKEYDNENAPRRRIKSPHQPDQDSDNDGHDSTRFASGKENYNENAPRRRVKSPHHTDQDSDHDGYDSRRYALGKKYDNESAPRKTVKSPHQHDQDSRPYSPDKENYKKNAPRRRAMSPHHTDQDSDNENAPRRRARSPYHIDQDSDHDGHDARYAPGKENYNENAPRRRARRPHNTDQDSDNDGHDSRTYAPGKEYDNENVPMRRVKNPHQPDQDSRRYAPGKEYDHENASRRRARRPHHTDQDSNHEGHDSRRSATSKEFDNENAPRRRARSPHHTDSDSDHDAHDSRRYAARIGYNENAPRRAKSPNHIDQDSEHDGRESTRYDRPPKYDYENSPRRIVKSPQHADQDSDHDGLDSRIYAPSKDYYNEIAPRGNVKSPRPTDHDGHHFRKSASSKDYEYGLRKEMRRPHHTGHYPDDDDHDSRKDHGMNISSVTARAPDLHHRSPSDRRSDNGKNNYLQHMDSGRRNEYRDDNTGGGSYHKYSDGMHATRRRDDGGKEDYLREFERLTIDEKRQSPGRWQRSRGALNYCPYQSQAVPEDKFHEPRNRPSTRRQRQYPPSGDVRMDPYHSKPSPVQQETKFSASNLIAILLKFNKYEASILELMERCGLEPSLIRNVVQTNPNLFEIKQETVCLRPKVKICDAHQSNHGCLHKSSCNDLHICPKFVMSSCMSFGCTLGHSLESGHNISVMKPFMINNIPESQRLEVLKLSIPAPQSSLQLKVCYNYSSGKCVRNVCGFLHICSDALMNKLQCPNSFCKLNHNLLSPENRRVLGKHGVDTNESPRDVLKVLRETHPLLFRQEMSASSNRNSSANQTSKYSSGNTGNYRSGDDNITPSNSRPAGTVPADRQNISNPNRGNSPQRGNFYSSGETSNSMWSFHYEGNTEVAEICFYSVTSRCRYEDTGCKRLHAKQHFHWQVKERGRGWVNLRKNQVDSLENAYCDPDKDDVKIPSIDPSNCPKGLLKLFGQDKWQADFKSMSLHNPKTNVTLTLRRLCSEDVDGSVKACRNQWYFLDQNNVWIQYGNTDTTKRDFLASNITSNDIERHFIKTPSVPLTFKNSMFLYVLDFGQMMQTNTKTNVSRKVKRRPVPHMQHNQQKTGIMSKLMSWTT